MKESQYREGESILIKGGQDAGQLRQGFVD